MRGERRGYTQLSSRRSLIAKKHTLGKLTTTLCEDQCHGAISIPCIRQGGMCAPLSNTSVRSGTNRFGEPGLHPEQIN